MKILLTNRALNHWYGTENWTLAMAKELTRLGHEVTVFTKELGKVSDEVQKFAKVTTFYDGHYDFAICNHLDCYFDLPPDLFRIYTSHSAFIGCEKFPEDANVKVGVSEEIGGEHIIPNGIDTDRFAFGKIEEKLTDILYLCNPIYEGGKDFMKEACKDYNLITIERETGNIEDLIYRADLVVGFGRGLLEAMSCGRNVMSADYRITYMDGVMGGGMVTEENFDELSKTNFTGRPNQLEFTIESFREELKKYDPKRGEFLRKKIEDNYDIKKTAQRYLDLFENR